MELRKGPDSLEGAIDGSKPRGCSLLMEGIDMVIESHNLNKRTDGKVYTRPGMEEEMNETDNADKEYVTGVNEVFSSVNCFKNWQIELIIEKDIDNSITHDENETVKRLTNAA